MSKAKSHPAAALPEEELDYFFAALSAASASSPGTAEKEQQQQPKSEKREALDNALEKFRMDTTNIGTSAEEIALSKSKLCEALSNLDLLDTTNKLFEEHKKETAAAAEDAKKKPSFTNNRVYQQALMQEVVPGLFISGWHPTADEHLLKSTGITHLLSCISAKAKLADKLFAAPGHYLQIPAEDNEHYNISKHFKATNAFIDAALTQNNSGGKQNKVLVFCGAGISRSGTCCCSYLIYKLKVDPHTAIDMVQKVRQVRQVANPNQNFRKQLTKFYQDTVVNVVVEKKKVEEETCEKKE